MSQLVSLFNPTPQPVASPPVSSLPSFPPPLIPRTLSRDHLNPPVRSTANFSERSPQLLEEEELEAGAVSVSAVSSQLLDVKPTVELLEAPLQGNTELSSLVTLVAPINTTTARAPLDVVVVVDKSGSMHGQKLKLVQKTLLFLCTQLSSSDRLSVVVFNERASRLSHLRKLNEIGKGHMAAVIQSLKADGGTNIGEGVLEALKILRERKTCNPLSSVLLLSDGRGGTLSKEQSDEYLPPGTTIHSFGYGNDHDARVLYSIAENARGTFTYLENNDQLGDAFAGCLGGLLSVWAQEVEVEAQIIEPHKLVKAYTSFPSTTVGSSVTIRLPDLLEGEKKDILFAATLANIQQEKERDEFALINVKYRRVSSSEVVCLPTQTLWIKRRQMSAAEVEEQRQKASQDMDQQRNRVITAEAIRSAVRLYETNPNNLEQVRSALIQVKQRLEKSSSRETPFTRGLISDVDECLSRYRSEQSVRNGGYAWAQQAQQQHWGQRANQNTNVSYSNTAQVCLQQRSRQYNNGP